jgi:hypothetical protein
MVYVAVSAEASNEHSAPVFAHTVSEFLASEELVTRSGDDKCSQLQRENGECEIRNVGTEAAEAERLYPVTVGIKRFEFSMK